MGPLGCAQRAAKAFGTGEEIKKAAGFGGQVAAGGVDSRQGDGRRGQVWEDLFEPPLGEMATADHMGHHRDAHAFKRGLKQHGFVGALHHRGHPHFGRVRA